MTARRSYPEHHEQALVIQWAIFHEAKYPELRLLFAIPNGAKLTPRAGKWYKDEGRKPGVPDLCLPVARLGYHGLFIEMKAPGATTTRTQRDYLDALLRADYSVAVCHSAEAAQGVLLHYLGGSD